MMGGEFGKKVKAHVIYKLKDGTVVPGATTITGQINKPALVGWAAKKTREGKDYRAIAEEAKQIGILAHEMVRCELMGGEPDLADYSDNQIDKARNAMLKFLAYQDEYSLEPVLIETPLVSEKYRYGGTPDYYGKRMGVDTYLDWKTGGVYPESYYQATAYWQLLIENGYPVKAVRILKIGRDESEAYEEYVVGALEQRWEGFMRLLEFYHINRGLP